MKFTRPSALTNSARRSSVQTGGNDEARDLVKDEIREIADVLDYDETIKTINRVAHTTAGSLGEFFNSDGATIDLLAVTTGPDGEVALLCEVYEALYMLWRETKAVAEALGRYTEDIGNSFVSNVKADHEGRSIKELQSRLRTLRASLVRQNSAEVAEEIDSIRAYLAIHRLYRPRR